MNNVPESEVAHVDFETRSIVDLAAAGVHVYAAHPDTAPWCMSYTIGNAPVNCWLPGADDPQALLDHVAAGRKVVAHNAPFELAIWNLCIRARIAQHWPELKLEQTFCTMAQASALALPAGLAQLAKALGLDIDKDMEGRALMMRMARPRKVELDGTIVWWTGDKAKLDRLVAYCNRDVEVERACCSKLPALSPPERRVWLIDQKINNRGIRVDIDNVKLANALVERATAVLNAELSTLTGGQVTSVSQVAKLAEWLRANGFPNCHSTTKGEVAAMLESNPAENVARVLTIRQLAGKSSTKKLVAMLACVNDDNRARGLFGYHGASTGRWVGRRVQPQNLPRPTYAFELVEKIIASLSRPNGVDIIDLCFGPPIDAIASCLRSMFIADDDKDLVAGDFANIEGRVLAWIAGEQWKLDAFRDFDAGVGHDLYKLAYGRSFNVDPATISKDDPRRQIGKVMELALGYQGGIGAFKSMAANYGLQVVATPQVLESDGPTVRIWRNAKKDDLRFLPKAPEGSLYELEVDEIKKAWRNAHPKIKSLWRALEDAALEAIQKPGKVISIPNGRIRFVVANGFLFCRLPNGRVLAYFKPHITVSTISWVNDEGEDVTLVKDAIGYFGVDGVTKQFGPQKAYGGMLAENVTQAVARDILVDAMFRAEAAGYAVVLHVHDELVAEIPKDFGSEDEFERLMCASEPWANGLPVSAPGVWRGSRYRK